MPVFQDYSPRVTPDIGSTPQVRTNAEAIGAGLQNLGQGLAEAGSAAAHYQLRQEQNQRYDIGNSWEDFQVQLNNDKEENIRNQQPGAAGLAVNGLKQASDKVTKWVQSLPEPFRKEYAGKAQTLLDTYAGSYAAAEAKGRGDYEIATNSQNVTRDQNQAGEQPDAVNQILANRKAQIDSMTLPPATKATIWNAAQKDIITSYRNAKYGTDPAKASAAAGVSLSSAQAPGASGYGKINAAYKAPLDRPGEGGRVGPMQFYSYLKSQGASDNEALMLTGAAANESSFNPNATHDGGSGTGLFGHNHGRLDMRGKDWQQQGTLALQELRSRPESALVNNAKSADDLAVAQMHFEQPRGYTRSNPRGGDNFTGRFNTIQYFSSLKNGANGLPAYAEAGAAQSDANGAQQAPQPHFTQPGDPLLSVFTPEERQSWVDGVVRNKQAADTAAAAAQQKQVASLTNQLENGILDNTVGMVDIQAARKSWLTDAGTANRLIEMVKKRDEDATSAQSFWTKTAAGAGMNPYNSDDKKAADSAFKIAGGDITALDRIYSAGGVMPPSAVTTLRGGLIAKDANTVGAALTIASNAMSRDPHAFTGLDGGGDIEKKALLYTHLVNDRGLSTSQAVQEVMRRDTPEYKSKLPSEGQQTEFLKSITPDVIAKQFGGWLPGSTPRFAAGVNDLSSEMLRDYKEAAQDAYNSNGGDADAAKAAAYSQVNKTWGVSNVLGISQLIKYPVDKTYPPIGSENGGYEYIRAQALNDVKQATGYDLDSRQLIIVPVAQTAQAFLRGDKRPPYALGYMWRDENGQIVPHILNTDFRPDPEKARNEVATFQQQQTDMGRPLQEGYNAAVAQQKVTPVPGPNTSFDNADKLQIEPPPERTNPYGVPKSGNDAFRQAQGQFWNQTP